MGICIPMASRGVSFYTETKTVTSRWFDDPGKGKVNMTIRLK